VLNFWEKYLMDFFRSEGYELLNIKEGGSQIGSKHTPGTKLKMSIARVGTKNWRFGVHHTQEAKAAIGLANSGENGTSKLNRHQVRAVLSAKLHGARTNDLAQIFSLNRHTLAKIFSGECWSTVTGISKKVKQIN
jgi:hypothetical protein